MKVLATFLRVQCSIQPQLLLIKLINIMATEQGKHCVEEILWCFMGIKSVSECKKPLSADAFFVQNKDRYCTQDYQRLFGTKCHACDKFVEGQVVTVLSKTYHQDCIACAKCRSVHHNILRNFYPPQWDYDLTGRVMTWMGGAFSALDLLQVGRLEGRWLRGRSNTCYCVCISVQWSFSLWILFQSGFCRGA